MRTRTKLVSSLLASLASLLAAGWSHPAHACGGCFSPPETITTVDAHRMAIALSPTRTVLWDQIRYSGDPEDFVWVLPVPTEEATVDVADDLFFAELEQQTAVQVQPPALPPPPVCPGPPGGYGGALDAGGAGASPDAGVDVYREEVVGPYETAVIGSGDAGALVTWLNDHGYQVPAATEPTIQFYADLGNRFIVLRLAPDQGVSAMQPVRIEYPGYMATFPLKMVTIGAYGKLALTLWVIAEQRYESKNYPTVEIPQEQLVWDFSLNRSNYKQLFASAIDGAGGRGFVAQFAEPLSTLYFTSDDAARAEEVVPYAYLTRLQTDMLVDHLTDDLILGPAAGGPLSRYLQANQLINPPPPPTCPDWDGDGVPDGPEEPEHRGIYGCSTGGSGGAALLALAFLGLLGLLRKRPTR